MKKVSVIVKERGVSDDNQVVSDWFTTDVEGDGTHGTEIGKSYTYVEAMKDTTTKAGKSYKAGMWFLIAK